MLGNGKPSIKVQFIRTCPVVQSEKFVPMYPCDGGQSLNVLLPSLITGTVSIRGCI